MLVKAVASTPGARFERMRGFTLIELIFTITVMAILATLAAPSFRQYILTQRVRNASYDLMAAIMMARSEAITRNTTINLVRCGANTWDGGWGVPACGAGATTLNQQAYSGLSITDSASLAQITYGKEGRTTTTSTKFTIQPSPATAGVTLRCVSIGLSGVPSISVGAC